MAGLSDIHHDLCLGLALWNGADPILKERMFGLTGPQGNHGEDVKEYWWYLDALPSHAWLRWRYHYPQAAFPYQQLVEENARRSRDEPEFELLDTGVFDDDRYWSVDVAYAKASPTEVLARITIENHGRRGGNTVGAADPVVPQHLAGHPGSRAAGAVPRRRRRRRRAPAAVRVPPRRRARPGRHACREALFCDNETNTARLFGSAPLTAYPEGRHQRSRGLRRRHGEPRPGAAPRPPGGTELTVPAGGTAELRLRLHRPDPDQPARGSLARQAFRRRDGRPGAGGRRVLRGDRPRPTSTPSAMRVLRQSCAGLVWSKQIYPYRVNRWLDGDPGQPRPPAGSPHRPQRRLAAPGLLRRAGDAGPVGVPVVRRLGPGVPHDHLGAPGPGVRQVPAAGAAAGVVPAPQRGAAGVRVELRRRQPAGPRAGRDPGVHHRRRHRPRLPRSGSSTSCCSTSPGG